MAVLSFTGLVLVAVLGAAPAPAVHSAHAPTVVADSEVVLSVEALTKMTTFWAAFMKEAPAVRDTGRRQHQKPFAVKLDLSGRQESSFSIPGLVDMVALAAQYPSVAADLKQAGLTAVQWEQYRDELITAWAVKQAIATADNTLTVPPTSVLGKNLAFLEDHPKEFDALKATGMWFPKVQVDVGRVTRP